MPSSSTSEAPTPRPPARPRARAALRRAAPADRARHQRDAREREREQRGTARGRRTGSRSRPRPAAVAPSASDHRDVGDADDAREHHREHHRPGEAPDLARRVGARPRGLASRGRAPSAECRERWAGERFRVAELVEVAFDLSRRLGVVGGRPRSMKRPSYLRRDWPEAARDASRVVLRRARPRCGASSGGSWNTTPSSTRGQRVRRATSPPRERAQALDHLLDQDLGRGRAGRHADAARRPRATRARSRRRVCTRCARQRRPCAASSTRRLLFDDSGAPTTSTQLGLADQLLHRVLAVLRRVADVVLARAAGSRGSARASASSTSRVSSTESVVCVSTREPRGIVDLEPLARRPTFSTRCMRSGACPIVPSTSTWPAWPTSTISWPLAREAPRLDVHLGDERAGRVDRAQALLRRAPRAPRARRRAR